jgi:twitching motility two-component system response regulator PilH
MSKILIADDSATGRLFIAKILEENSHEIDMAADGEMAENMAMSGSYDLIILDVVMPHKNGFQVCRDLKKTEKLKNTPILMCTIKGMESDKFWAKKQGASDFIVKPFSKQQLIEYVNRLLKK